MFESKQLKTAILMAVLAMIGVCAPAQAGAQPASNSQDTTKKECIQHENGTKDCSPIFIEVGQPMNSVLASCSGNGCDGKDPYAEGCTVSYGVIDMRYIYAGSQQIGYVQLWWSNTCQVNWSRTVRTVAGNYVGSQVMRDNNSNLVWDGGDTGCFRSTETSTAVYSCMLYAPTLKAAAEGQIRYNSVVYSAQTGWN